MPILFSPTKAQMFANITFNIVRQMNIAPFKKGGTGTLILVLVGTVLPPGRKVKVTKRNKSN